MAKLNPLPTRIISDIEELRPALAESIEKQRLLARIRGLSDAELECVTDVLVNLQVALRIVDRMRGREWDIANDGQSQKKTGA